MLELADVWVRGRVMHFADICWKPIMHQMWPMVNLRCHFWCQGFIQNLLPRLPASLALCKNSAEFHFLPDRNGLEARVKWRDQHTSKHVTYLLLSLSALPGPPKAARTEVPFKMTCVHSEICKTSLARQALGTGNDGLSVNIAPTILHFIAWVCL